MTDSLNEPGKDELHRCSYLSFSSASTRAGSWNQCPRSWMGSSDNGWFLPDSSRRRCAIRVEAIYSTCTQTLLRMDRNTQTHTHTHRHPRTSHHPSIPGRRSIPFPFAAPRQGLPSPSKTRPGDEGGGQADSKRKVKGSWGEASVWVRK